jgi:hypothetical protein
LYIKDQDWIWFLLLLLFSFTSLLTPHRTLVNAHKINKCAKFGNILLGSSSNNYRIIARNGYWKYDHECRKTHQIKRVCGTCYAHEFNLNAFRRNNCRSNETTPFSPGTQVSSTYKTDRHDITEILLKVSLNTINQTIQNIHP